MGKNLKEGVEKGVIKTISDNTLEEDLGTLKEGIGSEPEKPTFAASLYGEPRGVVNSSGNPLRKTGAVRQIDHDPPKAVPIKGTVPNYEQKVTWDPESLPTGSLTTIPNPEKVKLKKPKVTTTRQVTTKF